jgi:Trk K+ transport system NAD-binding subunit
MGSQVKAQARRRASRSPKAGRAAPQREAGFLAKQRYRFDNALARGPLVVIAYLGLLSLLVILVAGLLATVADFTFGGGADDSVPEDFWQAMLRMVDAGTFAGDTTWPLRIVSLIVTILGIFLAGSLIGLIANAVDQKVDELRRGRNPVIESRHTLVLGWSPAVPRIVGELVIANQSEKDAAVVVLGPLDPLEMEEAIRGRVPDLRTTRLVCRNGEPWLPSDLERCAAAEARSIIVVSGADGDAGVVKAILAVRTIDPEHAHAHVVAELDEVDHARTLRTVSNGRVLTVSSNDVVAEVTAQACLRSGLGAVFTELLDFDGDEIYFTRAPAELVGRSYRDALVAYDRSSVLGIADAERVELNPSPDRTIADGDDLIMVAEDDSAVAFTGVIDVAVSAAATAERDAPGPVHIIMVGWSGFGSKVLKELDEFLPDGSRVDIVVDTDLVDPRALDGIGFAHGEVVVRGGDGGPDHLAALADGDQPDQVIVLAYRDALSVDDADARTLLALLTLRQAWPSAGTDHVRIVAELRDQRNLVLAAPVGVDDLIVSDALASLLMSQLSENADLQAVFDDLFDADGAIVDLLPVTSLVASGPHPFSDIVAAASVRSASAFGYRVAETGEVVVNPAKSAVVDLGPSDEVVAIITRP